MKIDRIIAKDFLSYENIDYAPTHEPTLIHGVSILEDGEERSNGSGKSGFISAIEYAITAQNSRGVNDSDLVRRGHKEGRVELYASCKVRRERIHINWTLKAKGSNLLDIKTKKDGGEWTDASFSNVNDGKKFILGWFDITKEDLSNYYLINRARFKSFFGSSNRERVELINRFSDASIVDGLETANSEEVDSIQGEVDKKRSEISSAIGKVELVETQIEEESNVDHSERHAAKIYILDRNINELESKIDDNGDCVKSLNAEKLELVEGRAESLKSIDSIKSEKAPKAAEIDEIKNDISTLSDVVKDCERAVNNYMEPNREPEHIAIDKDREEVDKAYLDAVKKLTEVTEGRSKLKQFIEKINVKLSGALTCPKCSYEFVPSSKFTVDEMNQKKADANVIIDKMDDVEAKARHTIKLTDVRAKVLEKRIKDLAELERKDRSELLELNEILNKAIGAMNKRGTALTDVERELAYMDKRIMYFKSDIQEFNTEVANIDREIKDVKADNVRIGDEIKDIQKKKTTIKVGNNKETVAKLKATRKELAKSLKELETEASKVEDRLLIAKGWTTSLKGFKTFIANRSLEMVEVRTNKVLKEMGSELYVSYSGSKVLASGKVKAEVNATVIRNGEEVAFNSLSAGERSEVIFSSVVTNKALLDESNRFGGLDMVIVDEVLDALDSNGIGGVMRAAESMKIPLMLVSHTIDSETFNKIVIKKEGGISKIVA